MRIGILCHYQTHWTHNIYLDFIINSQPKCLNYRCLKRMSNTNALNGKLRVRSNKTKFLKTRQWVMLNGPYYAISFGRYCWRFKLRLVTRPPTHSNQLQLLSRNLFKIYYYKRCKHLAIRQFSGCFLITMANIRYCKYMILICSMLFIYNVIWSLL